MLLSISPDAIRSSAPPGTPPHTPSLGLFLLSLPISNYLQSPTISTICSSLKSIFLSPSPLPLSGQTTITFSLDPAAASSMVFCSSQPFSPQQQPERAALKPAHLMSCSPLPDRADDRRIVQSPVSVLTNQLPCSLSFSSVSKGRPQLLTAGSNGLQLRPCILNYGTQFCKEISSRFLCGHHCDPKEFSPARPAEAS